MALKISKDLFGGKVGSSITNIVSTAKNTLYQQPTVKIDNSQIISQIRSALSNLDNVESYLNHTIDDLKQALYVNDIPVRQKEITDIRNSNAAIKSSFKQDIITALNR